jgi:type IV pilus assembly protein PilW
MNLTRTSFNKTLVKPGHQLGLSLVELMVAITIGMLVVAALLALFLNITRNNSELAKANAQIENGRFAIQLLENDVVHAGFWGTHVPQYDNLTFDGVPNDQPTAVPDPCLAYNATNWNAAYQRNLIGIPVQSDDSASICTGVITNKIANTDVLVVRHAETCLPGATNCEADTSGKLYFQASLCELENATPYILDTGGFSLRKRSCAVGDIADKRKFISNIYYVRNYATTVGDGIPTLMRSSFDLAGGTLAHQTAQPLIEGIEGFRVDFGIDDFSETGTAVDHAAAVNWVNPLSRVSPTNRGDGAADGSYVSCGAGCSVAQLSNTVAVKLHVLARAKEPTPGYTDTKTYILGNAQPICSTAGTCSNKVLNPNFKRHVFSTTVRLNNISGRRETP